MHHTSFLWDFAVANMALLKHPEKSPEYRAARPHSSFLCKLKDFVTSKGAVVAAPAKRMPSWSSRSTVLRFADAFEAAVADQLAAVFDEVVEADYAEAMLHCATATPTTKIEQL